MIFRIVQEQTSNILKHAEADSAVIRLKHEGDMVNLQISDNGKGISIEQQSHVKGSGSSISPIGSMHNGTMEIITTPGKGCTLDIHFPVEGLSACLINNNSLSGVKIRSINPQGYKMTFYHLIMLKVF